MADPYIEHLDGDFTYESSGVTYRIDLGSDAVVTDGDNDFANLEVLLDGAAGLVGIHTESGKVTLSDGIISVAGTVIGEIVEGLNSSHLIINFYDDATAEQVQELIRALTYTSTSSTSEFGGSDVISVFLQDKAGNADLSFVTVAEKVLGTAGSDTFSAVSSVINPGDELDGGGGEDVFELTGGGIFDLHRMGSITGIETIRGSAGNDFITINGAHLSGIKRIESGGTNLGDTLTITGTAIDLSGVAVEGFKSIALAENGAKMTVDNAATAKLVTGYDTVNDTLILTSGSLTALERQILHQQGIDTIITKGANGEDVVTTHRAPQIASFNGATVNASIGTAVFLDAGRDAILTADSIMMKSLFIRVDGSSDPTEKIAIDTRDGVTLSQGHTYLHVNVDGLTIGRVDGVGTSSVSFIFNDQATNVRVQKLIRSLTYTKTGGTADALRKVEFSLTDIGGRETTAEVSVNVASNAAPSELGLSRTSVQELSRDGTWIGDLSATDAPGSTFTYTLVNDAGGRFKIEGNKLKVDKGTLLDHEQAKSHIVQVKVTDQGGLSIEKSFTIRVDDVGREIIVGTVASEVFVGGAGSDRLNGGYGNDRLTGGKGKDTFVFKSTLNKTKNVDTITDFRPKDDTIQLENGIFKKLKKTGVLKKDFFTVGSKAKDKNDYIVFDKKKGCLYYDADGSGKGKAVLFAKLKASLNHKDFFVI